MDDREIRPARHSSAPAAALNTFGRINRTFGVNGFHLCEVSIPPQLRLSLHEHELAQICIVSKGEYVETARGHETSLRSGSVVIRPAGEPHSNTFGGQEAAALLIDIEPARYRSVRQLLVPDDPAYIRSGIVDDLRREIELELRRDDESSALALEGYILLLISRLARYLRSARNQASPLWYNRVVGIINASYKEGLSLATLAHRVNIHPVKIAAAFRRYQGQSVGDYITALRLAHARSLLLESSLPIVEIAHSTGFYDQSHFGKAFKLRYGVSPGRLRRMSRAV
ncbi:MAG TPA: AraC family transcriptional regulator [Blastocatellia bacterium]|nr:AraC family transcriptional regulator [Blastocatellia bacterium]